MLGNQCRRNYCHLCGIDFDGEHQLELNVVVHQSRNRFSYFDGIVVRSFEGDVGRSYGELGVVKDCHEGRDWNNCAEIVCQLEGVRSNGTLRRIRLERWLSQRKRVQVFRVDFKGGAGWQVCAYHVNALGAFDCHAKGQIRVRNQRFRIKHCDFNLVDTSCRVVALLDVDRV